MKVYLGIKYQGNKNKVFIDQLSEHLQGQGHQVQCVVRDLEEWGNKTFDSSELMKKSFEMINCCDAVLIELTEKGVGLGIEAGYAYSKGIPVITVAKIGSDISTTLQGISKATILYEDISQIIIS